VTPARRGWVAPAALVFFAAFLSIVNPGLLIFVPLALLLIALPPRRPGLVFLAAAILAIAVVDPPSDPMWWWVSRGWALLLGAWFVVFVVLLPRAAFLSRALAALAGSAASAVVVFVTGPGGFAQVDGSVVQRLREGAATLAAVWNRSGNNGSGALTPSAMEAMNRAAELQALIFPALLGLASIAALAVAWWLWRRFAEGETFGLGPLRQFRFRDELVWLVVIAIVLIVLPFDDAITRTGANLATFMGALYALRGLAVIVSLFGTPGWFGVVLSIVMVLFLFPMVLACTLVVGLTDTWLDLRARAQQPPAGT